MSVCGGRYVVGAPKSSQPDHHRDRRVRIVVELRAGCMTMTRRADPPRGPEHYLQVDNSSAKVDGVAVFGRLFSPLFKRRR